MITIIFGAPRAGKTALMTHFLTQAMFDRERMRKMRNAIKYMNNGGFNFSIPKHPVVANYDVVGHKFGYTPRLSKTINPFRLGYANEKVKTHFLEPFTVIGITEGQKYFNSRMSISYPDWQSRWFEQHGHNHYDIYIDVQRPKLIDVNIRELSSFIEIVKKDNKVDNKGKIVAIKWLVRCFESSAELESYFASGKKVKTTYLEKTIKIDYNVHNNYNSQMCKPKFYAGHIEEDYDTVEHKPLVENLDGYIDYLKSVDDELPKDFYNTKRGG